MPRLDTAPHPRQHVPVPGPAEVGDGVHALASLRSRVRATWLLCGLGRWQGRKSFASPSRAIVTLFQALFTTAVTVLAWSLLSMTWVLVTGGHWALLAFLYLVLVSIVAGFIALVVVRLASTQTVYANASERVFLQVRSRRNGTWEANNHVKSRHAADGDAHNLRVAVMQVLLPAAAAEGVRIKLSTPSQTLADSYVADAKEAFPNLDDRFEIVTSRGWIITRFTLTPKFADRA